MTKASLEKYFYSRKCILLNNETEIKPLSKDIFIVEGAVTYLHTGPFFFVMKLDSWDGPIVYDADVIEFGDRIKVFGFLKHKWNPDFRGNHTFQLALHSIKAIKQS
jgi:hypothetical protein